MSERGNQLLIKRLEDAEWDPQSLDLGLSVGFISLMVWSNFLRMTVDERNFVLWLADQMREFEKWAIEHPQALTRWQPKADAPERGTKAEAPTPPVTPTSEEPPKVDLLTNQAPRDTCPDCGESFTRQGMGSHRRLAHPPTIVEVKPDVAKMLKDKGEVAEDGHVHRWLLGAPIGQWVHGTCRDCSAVKDFPSTPRTEFSRSRAS